MPNYVYTCIVLLQVIEGLNAGLLPEDFQSIDAFFSEVVEGIGHDVSVIAKKDFVNASLSHGRVRQFSDAIVKAALMPYEMRRERTGSYGRARAESIRARAMTNQIAMPRRNTRERTNTVN